MTVTDKVKAQKTIKFSFNTAGNECASILESIDWSKTALGPTDDWPIAFKITLNTILTSSFPMAMFWGKDYIFFYNDAARFQNYGKHPFALGKKGIEIWEEQFMALKPTLDRLMETGESTLYENHPTPMRTPEGTLETAFLTYSFSPIYDERGKRSGILINGMDTTQSFLNYQKLEVSDRNFRNLVDQAPIGIAIIRSTDFTFELANEYYLNLIGAKNVVGKRIDEFVNTKEGNLLKVLGQVRERGISHRGKQSHVRTELDGSTGKRYTNYVYEPLREGDGRVDRILVLLTDVTEQVQSIHKAQDAEKELRELADSMPHLVWIAAPDGTISFISNRVAEFSGATRKADGTWRWQGMVHPDDIAATGAEWSLALQRGDFYQKEQRLQMIDGTYKWHISRAYPFKNNEGKILKWFGTATDIDAQKRLSEELELRVLERTKELQSSNNELAQVAYVASHDLQEPLRKIITFIGLLQRELPGLESKPKSYVTKIEQSAQRMTTLIKDILNFSQLGKPGHRFEQTDLNESINTIIGDLEILIQQKGAAITVDPLPSIEAIPQQMNQLFYNLLSNSLKFTREGVSPVVTIKFSEVPSKDVLKIPDLNPTLKYIQIQLQDNGIGFNNKFAEQIFTIFQRLNNRQDFSGTGIGLALCKKIAINHNGLIRATAVENQGATFTLILPHRQPKD